MRVLVTGGAGYIGSVTVRTLCEAGHGCVVLDSLVRGHRHAVDPRAELFVGEVGDREAVSSAIEGCDAVLHLAGLIEVAESQHEPARYFDANVSQPAVLLEVMADQDVDALVFSSTAAVYGEPASVPIPESAALQPINAYGLSKLTFERLLDWAASAYHLRSIRLRYFNVAGAWPDGSLGEAHEPETHIVPRVLRAIADGRREFEVFGGDYPTFDGTCVRDYLHVCDLADAHVLALEQLASGGSGAVFNLGNGRGFSNLEVVRACAAAVGREIEVVIGPRRQGDPAQLVATSDAARSGLGWTPRRAGLEQIVGDAWRWHSSRPHGYGGR